MVAAEQLRTLGTRSDQPVSRAVNAASKGPFKLAVITTYDGDFAAYIQDFANMLGPVFDALLGFSADGTGLVPVKDHEPQVRAAGRP